MNTLRPYLLAALLATLCFLGTGCALVRKGAARMVTPVASQLSEGLMRQSDVELVRDGAPAFLLMLDALTESHPENPAVLLAASEAQLAYATAFVDKADRERAKTMYRKAMTYGQRALAHQNRRFAGALDGPVDEFARSLNGFRKRDARTLITTATAWVMWIIASSDSPAALGEMPKVLAMMKRVHELDPGIREGGVDLFYGIYYTVLPLGGGRDLDKARMHFERSMDIAGPDYLLTRVTFAEFYARYAFDPELFEETLRQVLAAEPDVPDYTLMNAVAKMRARDLLELMEDLF
jgi:hypothetical protein